MSFSQKGLLFKTFVLSNFGVVAQRAILVCIFYTLFCAFSFTESWASFSALRRIASSLGMGAIFTFDTNEKQPNRTVLTAATTKGANTAIAGVASSNANVNYKPTQVFEREARSYDLRLDALSKPSQRRYREGLSSSESHRFAGDSNYSGDLDLFVAFSPFFTSLEGKAKKNKLQDVPFSDGEEDQLPVLLTAHDEMGKEEISRPVSEEGELSEKQPEVTRVTGGLSPSTSFSPAPPFSSGLAYSRLEASGIDISIQSAPPSKSLVGQSVNGASSLTGMGSVNLPVFTSHGPSSPSFSIPFVSIRQKKGVVGVIPAPLFVPRGGYPIAAATLTAASPSPILTPVLPSLSLMPMAQVVLSQPGRRLRSLPQRRKPQTFNLFQPFAVNPSLFSSSHLTNEGGTTPPAIPSGQASVPAVQVVPTQEPSLLSSETVTVFVPTSFSTLPKATAIGSSDVEVGVEAVGGSYLAQSPLQISFVMAPVDAASVVASVGAEVAVLKETSQVTQVAHMATAASGTVQPVVSNPNSTIPAAPQRIIDESVVSTTTSTSAQVDLAVAEPFAQSPAPALVANVAVDGLPPLQQPASLAEVDPLDSLPPSTPPVAPALVGEANSAPEPSAVLSSTHPQAALAPIVSTLEDALPIGLAEDGDFQHDERAPASVTRAASIEFVADEPSQVPAWIAWEPAVALSPMARSRLRTPRSFPLRRRAPHPWPLLSPAATGFYGNSALGVGGPDLSLRPTNLFELEEEFVTVSALAPEVGLLPGRASAAAASIRPLLLTNSREEPNFLAEVDAVGESFLAQPLAPVTPTVTAGAAAAGSGPSQSLTLADILSSPSRPRDRDTRGIFSFKTPPKRSVDVSPIVEEGNSLAVASPLPFAQIHSPAERTMAVISGAADTALIPVKPSQRVKQVKASRILAPTGGISFSVPRLLTFSFFPSLPVRQESFAGQSGQIALENFLISYVGQMAPVLMTEDGSQVPVPSQAYPSPQNLPFSDPREFLQRLPMFAVGAIPALVPQVERVARLAFPLQSLAVEEVGLFLTEMMSSQGIELGVRRASSHSVLVDNVMLVQVINFCKRVQSFFMRGKAVLREKIVALGQNIKRNKNEIDELNCVRAEHDRQHQKESKELTRQINLNKEETAALNQSINDSITAVGKSLAKMSDDVKKRLAEAHEGLDRAQKQESQLEAEFREKYAERKGKIDGYKKAIQNIEAFVEDLREKATNTLTDAREKTRDFIINCVTAMAIKNGANVVEISAEINEAAKELLDGLETKSDDDVAELLDKLTTESGLSLDIMKVGAIQIAQLKARAQELEAVGFSDAQKAQIRELNGKIEILKAQDNEDKRNDEGPMDDVRKASEASQEKHEKVKRESDDLGNLSRRFDQFLKLKDQLESLIIKVAGLREKAKSALCEAHEEACKFMRLCLTEGVTKAGKKLTQKLRLKIKMAAQDQLESLKTFADGDVTELLNQLEEGSGLKNSIIQAGKIRIQQFRMKVQALKDIEDQALMKIDQLKKDLLDVARKVFADKDIPLAKGFMTMASQVEEQLGLLVKCLTNSANLKQEHVDLETTYDSFKHAHERLIEQWDVQSSDLLEKEKALKRQNETYEEDLRKVEPIFDELVKTKRALEKANDRFLRTVGTLTPQDRDRYTQLMLRARELFTVGELSSFAPLWHHCFGADEARVQRTTLQYGVGMDDDIHPAPALFTPLPPHLGLMRRPEADDGLLSH